MPFYQSGVGNIPFDIERFRRQVRLKKPETADRFKALVKHRLSVTALALSDDDLKGFSASKDGTVLQWDVESGKTEKFQWPSENILKNHGWKDLRGRLKKHSKSVLALAVCSDGRYLASGGLDRHVHLWDIRTRGHLQAFLWSPRSLFDNLTYSKFSISRIIKYIQFFSIWHLICAQQAFPGHQTYLSCLSFRQGTTDLFSGSFDWTVKYWNMEDRAYIDTICGHKSEVLTLDCLRKE
ncbi:U3 snoRNP-associated protein-like YAO [Durio zibethinus]|uniref:U3 snoRNP-associated protein-like YAO n=1 Tax=Durio zibethinus TaxID=66656 RepID=A0A6P5WF35_DURZI|nr:U3 snoRNP-associated protein-like YAO [Durio zibethinus]